ncbi:MAG TPA: hypothetical protein VHS53_14910 [Mucilaginibacter sp.]|nr:hypothetical protein [Mucilaginibacter sp.]
MSSSVNKKELHYSLLQESLKTYDPYDIWKTGLGLKVKNLFNNNRLLGAGPAMALTMIDLWLNNGLRIGYEKQEYPIARATAALTLLNHFETTGDTELLVPVTMHLEWLKENTCKGYSGACWGLGFTWPAGSGLVYDKNMPFSTHTPYALEALHRYTRITGDERYVGLIKSCFNFFEKDLCVIYEDDQMMATSYGPVKDRVAVNAVSYAMYAYAIFLSYFQEQEDYIKGKIVKLYNFIRKKQQDDGSWLYLADDENSFIDCFHSCFVVKNLLKTEKLVELDGLTLVAKLGADYILEHFIDAKAGLYMRFTKSNKLSLVKFDLYDNAEVLNMAQMM